MSDRCISIRLSEDEYQAVSKMAKAEGISLSQYCRMRLAEEKPTTLRQALLFLDALHQDMDYRFFENQMMMNMIIRLYKSMRMSMEGVKSADSPAAEAIDKEIEKAQHDAGSDVIMLLTTAENRYDPFLVSEIEDAVNKVLRLRAEAKKQQDEQ